MIKFSLKDKTNISVCMAAYNGEKYISSQIISIMGQLKDEDELIIVDDGSTDGTLSCIDSIVCNDHRVRIYRNPNNQGVLCAFEQALSFASKEIIILSDQDDVWFDGRVEDMRSTFNENAKIIGILSNSEICDASGFMVGRKFFDDNYIPKLTISSQYISNDFIGCCMAFRAEILSIALPFPRNISMHDWWLGSVALTFGEIMYKSIPTILYRRHGENASPSQRRSLHQILKSRFFNLFSLAILCLRNNKTK